MNTKMQRIGSIAVALLLAGAGVAIFLTPSPITASEAPPTIQEVATEPLKVGISGMSQKKLSDESISYVFYRPRIVHTVVQKQPPKETPISDNSLSFVGIIKNGSGIPSYYFKDAKTNEIIKTQSGSISDTFTLVSEQDTTFTVRYKGLLYEIKK